MSKRMDLRNLDTKQPGQLAGRDQARRLRAS